MDFYKLRKRHPEFIYESFKYGYKDNTLQIKFHFRITPDIDFFPTIKIPVDKQTPTDLDNLIFHLGLAEMPSYWKASCSPKITINAGGLTKKQAIWWKKLLINGLGEFFYVNNIDFRQKNFLNITSKNETYSIQDNNKAEGDLILISGGKDSAVVTQLLKPKNALCLNPTPAALEIIKASKIKNFIRVKRTIDPLLIQLNKKGYLNGHTPFSAYLAFLSVLVARLWGFKNVIVGNEKSASEANFKYLGLSVNHQYSKSYEFESLFRQYCQNCLSKKINYFSFLRPLNELQIAALFASTNKYDRLFKSCNVGRGAFWCGECAKCAFVYLIFYGLLDEKRRKEIFGEKEFFKNKKIKQHIKDLTGEGRHKPLDCVGTEEESKIALKLAGMDPLGEISKKNREKIIERIKKDWHKEHFLPKKYEKILKTKMNFLTI